MATNLSPELLAQILALAQGTGTSNNGAQQFGGSGQLQDWTVDMRRDVIGRTGGGGDASTEIYGDPVTRLYQSTGNETWGQDTANVFDAQGNYIGPSSGDSDNLAALKFILGSMAMYGGASALSGAGGGAAAGAAEAGAGAGSTAGASTLGGSTLAEGSALDALMAGGGYGGGTGATMTGGSALTSGGGSGVFGTTLGDAGLMSSAAGGYNFGGGGGSSPPPSTGGSGMNWGNALGALAGAASSRDQTQSSNRDPWAPAQPFLQQQIAQGQQLAGQYQRQPFSQAQQTAYGNYGGLLDALNGSAGGLLGGMSANASGANNYDRSNPRKQLQGGGSVDLSRWMPGLLGSLGTGGR